MTTVVMPGPYDQPLTGSFGISFPSPSTAMFWGSGGGAPSEKVHDLTWPAMRPKAVSSAAGSSAGKYTRPMASGGWASPPAVAILSSVATAIPQVADADDEDGHPLAVAVRGGDGGDRVDVVRDGVGAAA